MAAEEAELLKNSLPEIILQVYHIGSTSIPTIKAKPILDFVLVVDDLERFDQEADQLKELGYTAKGERGISGRRFFSKDTDGARSHHLHAFEQGHSEIERHLLFRDYLRTHPEAARRYQELKEELAQRFPNRSGNYTEAKSDFILSMDEVARYWHQRKQGE
jgi:GrpB-like predicted nucleotidyltransferase (UPF0157 family)